MLKKLTFLILLSFGLQLNAQFISLEKPDNLIHISSKLENGMRDFAFSIFSNFMCATDVWNTGCGQNNGRIYVYIQGGVTRYHVVITNNQTGQKVVDEWTSNSVVEALNLSPGTYRVVVDDSNSPVPNNYTLFAAEVKASSAPEVTLTPSPAPCGQNGKVESSTVKGVGPYTYKWSNGAITKDLLNVPAGNYTLTVSDANFCTDVATAKVEGTNGFVLSLDAQNASCRLNNGSIVSNVSGGLWPFTYQWSNGATIKDLLNIPAGNYSVTVTDAVGCKQFGMKTIFAIQRKDTFYISSLSCNLADTGTFFLKDTVSFRTGCDSVTFKRVGYSPKGVFTFDYPQTACISYKNRVDSIKGKTNYGCDSTHVISWNYVGISTRYNLNRDTCVSTPDKIDVVKSLMCGDDSIYYVTHFRVLPSDTIRLKESWCKLKTPDTTYFTNQFGCTSMKIISYSVKPLDTVFVTKDTCSKGMKNAYLSVLKTKDGCDSIVSITLNVLKDTTIYQSLYVCGLKVNKQGKQVVKNHLGCDSIVVLIDSLAPPAIVRSTVFRYSCDADSVKVGTYFDTTYFNYGCIEKIITLRLRDGKTTITLADTVLINQNLDTVIPVSKTLVNQYGCDSVVNRKWIYDKAEVSWLADSTNCGLKNSEIILTKNFKTYYGSDSIVKQKLITFESPKGKIDHFSHVPAPGQKGFIETSATGGKLPYTWEWNTGETSDDIYNLSGGNYVLTITDPNGCKDTLERGIAYFKAWSDTRGILTVGCGLADQSHFVDYGSQFGHLIVYDVNGTKLHEIQRVDMSVENIFTIPVSAKGKIIVMMYFDSGATPLKDSSVSF